MSDAIEDLMPLLQRRARRLCGSAQEAEDIAQETALRLWQRLQLGENIAEPKHYALVTLHNLVRQRWRRRQDIDALTDELAEDAPAAEARLACWELQQAIAALPPDQAVLMERVMAGVTSPRDLAREFGLPPGTVMSRLARARARLRRQMGLKPGESVLELM